MIKPTSLSFVLRMTSLGALALACNGHRSAAAFAQASPPVVNAPHPVTNPASPVMLAGDWVPRDPHQIDFDNLPRVPVRHVVVSDARARKGVNQHNYLIHHDGQFWAMWSDGPEIEDRVGQVVKYATSPDGVNWSEPEFMTPFPPNSGPDSPHYNTRNREGLRYISRGFWVREGQLLALASLDEAAGFFGPSLALRAFRWNPSAQKWEDIGVVQDNAINNFPPQRLPTGEWGMSRRMHDYSKSGVQFLIGGVEALNQWQSVPVVREGESSLKAEEPIWWTLPDGNLMALFRDNARSGYIFRSFSTNSGRTWSAPVKTDFPDARSKIHGRRLSDGRYALVSNSHPQRRDPLTLALSDDGLVFNKLFYLVGGRHVDYPHMIEHEGNLYIAHSGGKRSVEIQIVRLADLNKLKMPGPAGLKPESNDKRLSEPEAANSSPMLAGDWVPKDTQQIDFDKLPRIPSQRAVVSDVLEQGGHRVNQHNYLVHHAGKFWAMWSDGPGVSRGFGKVPEHDRAGQRVSFATSTDGLNWSAIGDLSGSPEEGYGWIARGFWIREGKLLALASRYKAPGYAGPGLQLHAFEPAPGTAVAWRHLGLVFDDALNNFPPKRLPSGEWMMSRRDHRQNVHFLIGGTKAFDHWESFPVIGYRDSALASEEPYWWVLPDLQLAAMFRDNRRSGFLHRAFSTDGGKTWSKPARTNFPDATSKFSGLRLTDGRYVLVSNPNPRKRDPLALSISDDGLVFTKMGYLVGGRHVDYPHVIEHGGHLLVAFATAKQTVEVLKIRLGDLNQLVMPRLL